MSQQSLKRFIKISELYLRSTDKQQSSFNNAEIDQIIASNNEPVAKIVQFTYRGYVAQITHVNTK